MNVSECDFRMVVRLRVSRCVKFLTMFRLGVCSLRLLLTWRCVILGLKQLWKPVSFTCSSLNGLDRRVCVETPCVSTRVLLLSVVRWCSVSYSLFLD